VDARARLAELARLRRELELAVRRRLDELAERLDDLRERLAESTRAALGTRRERLTRLERRLSARHPTSVLHEAQQRIARLATRADRAMQRRLGSERAKLAPLSPRLREVMGERLAERRLALAGVAGRLHALSPLGVLARGYAIVEDEHRRVLRGATVVSPGDRISVRLAECRLRARVEDVLESDRDGASPGAREP
jgi:exodeoxyribonuclease VII large subunit